METDGEKRKLTECPDGGATIPEGASAPPQDGAPKEASQAPLPATDLQIEYLKKLGATPKQLKGLDVDTARGLIEELKAGKEEVGAIEAGKAKRKGIALSPRLNALIVFLTVVITLGLLVLLLVLIRRLVGILISQ
jgi:hypothetical protein